MRMHTVALILIVLAGACRVVAPSADACPAACSRMRELGCVAGRPTPKGAACEEVCVNAAELIDVACWAKAKNCEECEQH